MAVNYDITQGDTFSTALVVRDQNEALVDLTGATVTMTVTDRTSTQLSQTIVTTHTNPTAGETTVTIAKTITATYPLGCFDFDTVVTLSDTTQFSTEDGTINARYADNQ